MNKQEKALKKLQEVIQQSLNKQVEEEQKNKEKWAQQEALEKEQEKRKKALKKAQAPKVKAAAKKIWEWYQKFIASVGVQQMVAKMEGKTFPPISISSHIGGYKFSIEMQNDSIFTPAEDKWELKLCMSIYQGKWSGWEDSEIDSIEDLVENIPYSVLIKFAKTITDETIWDIIGKQPKDF